MALSHFKSGLTSQYDREMMHRGRVGHPLAEVQQNNEHMDRQRHFLVSTNCYYGYQPLNVEGSRPHEEKMEIGDCEMTSLHTPASRKRTFDDVSGRQYKRFRTEEQENKDNAAREIEAAKVQLKELEELLMETHGCHMFHLLQCQ